MQFFSKYYVPHKLTARRNFISFCEIYSSFKHEIYTQRLCAYNKNDEYQSGGMPTPPSGGIFVYS